MVMSQVPVTVRGLSETGSACPPAPGVGRRACPGEKVSSKVIAHIIKRGQALAIRYTYEGFNRRYIVPNEVFGPGISAGGPARQCQALADGLLEGTPGSRCRANRSEIDDFLHKLRRISSRNELTHQVLKAIIQQQGKYLRTGNPLDLIPFTQMDLAKAISTEERKIDNSWISRLISGLSVLTPSGEEKALKFFFPTRKQVTKFLIKDFLDKESKGIVSGRIKRPYSDKQIRDILCLSFSTRSVACCRKEMGIPCAKRRLSGYNYPPMSVNFSELYPLTVESVQNNAPAGAGIYEFRLKSREVEYPNGKTPVIYIGSTTNIRKRLRNHVGRNTKNGRIRSFLRDHQCTFRYIESLEKWREEEAGLYLLFFSTYGAPPKCNQIRPGGIK